MIICSNCDVHISAPAMLINAASLRDGHWQMLCECGHRFSLAEFKNAGAVFRTGTSALRAMRATN